MAAAVGWSLAAAGWALGSCRKGRQWLRFLFKPKMFAMELVRRSSAEPDGAQRNGGREVEMEPHQPRVMGRTTAMQQTLSNYILLCVCSRTGSARPHSVGAPGPSAAGSHGPNSCLPRVVSLPTRVGQSVWQGAVIRHGLMLFRCLACIVEVRS